MQTQPAEHEQKPAPRRISGLWLFVLLALGLIVLNYRPAIETINCNASTLASKPDVIMLGAWWCPYCAQARQHFHNNNISYCEYDMERTEEGKKLYREAGSGGIPILLIGQYTLSGFDPNSIKRALALKNRS
jgi:glutaredoxin